VFLCVYKGYMSGKEYEVEKEKGGEAGKEEKG
jgi:hypothetical protein